MTTEEQATLDKAVEDTKSVLDEAIEALDTLVAANAKTKQDIADIKKASKKASGAAKGKLTKQANGLSTKLEESVANETSLKEAIDIAQANHDEAVKASKDMEEVTTAAANQQERDQEEAAKRNDDDLSDDEEKAGEKVGQVGMCDKCNTEHVLDLPCPEGDDDDETGDDTEKAKEEEVVSENKARHCAFFSQYIENLEAHNPDQAIQSLNNCIKHMLAHDDAEAFDDVLDMFKERRKFLSPKTMLQSAARVPAADRAKLETVATIFHILVNNPEGKMNLDHVRTTIKNEAFVNWLAKQIRK